MDWSKFLQPRQFPERNLGTSLAREFPYRAHVYSDARIPKRIAPLGMGNLFHARAGVQAALMASFGFDSVADEIDRFGEAYDVAMLTQSPTPFHYMTGEMELKPWVCSRHGQGAMQALESLVSTHGIGARDITAVRLHLSNTPGRLKRCVGHSHRQPVYGPRRPERYRNAPARLLRNNSWQNTDFTPSNAICCAITTTNAASPGILVPVRVASARGDAPCIGVP